MLDWLNKLYYIPEAVVLMFHMDPMQSSSIYGGFIINAVVYIYDIFHCSMFISADADFFCWCKFYQSLIYRMVPLVMLDCRSHRRKRLLAKYPVDSLCGSEVVVIPKFIAFREFVYVIGHYLLEVYVSNHGHLFIETKLHRIF